MSNVQVKISNVDVAQVLVQTWSGNLIKSLNAGENDWFAVTAGGEVSVQADTDVTKIVVKLAYAGPGSPASLSTSSIILDLYNAPVYVQAAASMSLMLQSVVAASVAGDQGAQSGSQLQGWDGAVKCGEIIIYPPA